MDSLDGYLVEQRFDMWKPRMFGLEGGQAVNQSFGIKVMGARRIDGPQHEIDLASGLINPGISITQRFGNGLQVSQRPHRDLEIHAHDLTLVLLNSPVLADTSDCGRVSHTPRPFPEAQRLEDGAIIP